MKIVLVALCLIFVSSSLLAEDLINMDIIKAIESSGNADAYNPSSRARGLYQITEVVLQEWNTYHPNERYVVGDLFIAGVNKQIAYWYMNVRIPSMLKYYGIEDTIKNRLISYNAGISYVVYDKKLPVETINYIRKYNRRR